MIAMIWVFGFGCSALLADLAIYNVIKSPAQQFRLRLLLLIIYTLLTYFIIKGLA
jgi:hypothetical protein